MKDPNRINKITNELKTYWNSHPNWRLGQLISNLSYELIEDNDPFFIEDEKLLELLIIKNKKTL